MVSIRKKSGLARLGAWPVLAVFLFMETAGQGSALAVTAQGGSLGTPSEAGKFSLPDWLRLLPAETAKVESVRDSQSDGPFVVLLQDAHSNPEAQRNISQVLEYLAARQTKAGGKLFVAVEGARGDLHPEYFDFFPDFTEAGDSVVESLLEKGELSGTELFAWSRYKANKAAVTDQSVLFSGVETTDLYRDNLAAYRELLNNRPLFSKLLENGESALQSKISQNLNPDLVRFYKERAKRKNGQFGLRRKDAGQGDLSVYADYLKTQSEKVLGIQLEDPIEQLRFPNFVRLLKLKRHQVDLQSSSLAEAWKKFAGQLEGLPEHSALAAAFGKLGRDYGVLERTKEAVSDHGLRELSARKLLEEFEKLERDNGFSWKANASLANALKVIVLQSEVDTAFLFEEMERLENGVLEALARSSEEKKWVHKIRDFEGLKRLLYLEMTRSDLDRIKSSRPDFRELLSEILDEEDQKSLMTTAGRALTFYRQARERDEALVMNALDFSKRVSERFSKAENARPLLVLVSGGFHAEGIQEILRDREMDFALVTPRITRTDRGQLYARVMSGENANLETYFKSRQPFSTKQEALFFREAVETAIPHWLEHGSSSDEVNDLRRLFSRHPVFSESLSVEMQENPAQTFVFTPAQGGEFQTASGSAISSSLLSADIGFSRAVDSQRRTPQRFSYHWKPSRSLSSKPADVSMPAGRSELRAIPGDLTPQEIAFAEQNILAMYSAVERSEGPDVVVIVSAQESERRYWKERLEAMKGQVIGRDTVVFSVLESYGGGVPPGNGLGSLLAYQSAREESPSQAGVSWKALMERIKRQKGRDANIAIYHTAGFGSRVWPITGSEFGSKSRISMPRYLDQNGRKVPMTLLESTLFQSSIFAKNRSGRIMVFWGDQVFIPTVPLEELQSSTDSPVEILALVGQFPYEDIVNKYGLIALESETPGQWTAARLMQKPKTVEAARNFIAAHSKITAAAKSLGSFTVDRSFWDAMMRSYRSELNEETPSEQAKFRADTDGDWWIPLTTLEFALKGSEAEVSLFQSAQDLKKYLVSRKLDQPEFTDRILRLYLNSRKVSSQPLMRVVNAGEKSLFWDFGNIGVEEGTTEGIFRRNILILLQDSPEGKLSRQFWGVPEPFTGTVPGTNVRAENSIITASELLPGSNGVIQNSVVSGMRGIFELDVQDSFLYGLTDERGSAAEGPLALNARHAIGYQLKLSLPLNIPEGHILAGVPVLGEDVVLRTTELSDAKAVWLKAMFENPVAFGSAANLIRMAEADRSALIAGVSLSDLKYRGFFDHKGNQHAVIEGVDASRNPVIAALHVTSLDQFTDAELNEAIFSPRVEGAVFSGKLYDKEKEVLLLTYSARSELRSVGIESIRPELESLLAAASDEASLKSGFLKLIYGKLSPEQDTALRRFYSAARLNKLPYEFTEHFEGLFSSRTQAAGKDTFRSYIESELSGTATDLNGLVLDIYGAFLKTTDFSRLSTKFFRLDHAEFTRFFDTLVEEKMFAGDKSITVKSLGVSSGEEPYTLAMMIYYALKKYYTAHEREIVSKEGESSFPLWAESWNVSIEAYDYELLNLALTGNGLFDFNYDDPVGFGEVDLYLDEPWLYTADTSTGQLEPSETWRRSPETDSGTYFIFRKLLRDHLNPGDKLRFQFSAIDLLKGWMKPVYVNLRGPADARVVSRTQANAVVATYLRGSVTLDNEDDYLIQALEGSRDSRYSSIALTSNLNIKEGERSELRRTSDADDLNNVFLKAFKKLDPETLEGMRTLRLLSSRITSPGFFPNRDARQAAKIEELPELTSDRDLQEALTVLLDDYQMLTAVREVATNDEESDIRFDPEAQTLSYSPDYEVAIQSRIDEALRVFEEGSYVDVQVAMGSLLRETRLGFSSEIRKRLKLSAVREFEKWRILIEVFDAETGVRSELRSAEKAYPEAFQFTSRPVVTTLGDSARVEITFKSDAAALEKSEIFFHWGDYDLGPLDWTDHEVLSWDIQDLGGGIYKASKIIQPGKIGEFGVTAYAQNRVTGERVWQGKSRSDDAMMRIDLPPKTVLEDLRRNLKKQEAIQSIRQSLVESNPYESFVETIRRLVIDEEMRGMGKIVYDAVKDVPRFRAVISEIYGRLKEDSKIWNPVYKEIALPALRALETLGIGEIVFVAPEGPHAIAGGLAKVIEGLAKALSESGVSVTVITPLYEDNQGKKHDSAQALIEKGFLTESGERVAIQAEPVAEIGMTFGPMYDSGTHMTGLTDDKIRSFQRTVQSRVYETKADGVRYLFLRHPRLADKLYAKVPSSEELRRAVFLSRAALEVVQNRALGVDPQMIISNDWVTGLIPVLLQKDPRYAQDPLLENVGTIHMIHNYGRDYQGRIFTNQYGLDLWPMLGLDHAFYKDVADPNDDRFLNITSSAMDHINRSILTVSRPYAEQMLTPEAGEGLDNILNPLNDALFGISNGIDEAAARKTFWKKGEEARGALGLAPLLEEYSEEGFLANLWEYKNAALVKTQRDFGLTENPDALFLPMIGRVAEQKGIRLLTETEDGVTVLESLLKMDSRVQIFLGGPVAEGDSTAERLRDLTLELQERYPGRIHGEYTFIPGATTLQVMLAGRFFLMPSRYEPGGITQLESLAAGTPVVARNVGGIAATLINYFDDPVQGNGFLFTDFSGAALRGTLAGAFEAVARDPGLLRTLSDRSATAENDWHDRIRQYLSLLQLGAGVIRPMEDEFTTDYDYLSDRTAIINDLRPRNRSELRSEGFLSSPQFDLKVSQYVANLDAQRRNRDGLNDADYLDESLREFLLPLTELIGIMSRDPEQAWQARRFLTEPDQRELARRFAVWVQDRVALKTATSDDNVLEADLIAAGQEALWVVMVAYIDSNLFSPVRKLEKLPVTLHFDAETLESYFAGNRKLLPSPSSDEPAVTDLWFVYDPHSVFGLVGSHRERGLPPHAKGGIRYISPVNADGDYLNLRLYMSLFRDPTGRNVAQQGVVVDLFDLVRAQETKNMLGTEFHGAKAEYTYLPGSDDAAAFKKFAAAFLDAGILDHEVPGPDIGMSGDKVQSGIEEAKRITLRHLSREVEYLGLLVSDSVPGEDGLALLGMTAEQLQELRNLFKTTFPGLKDPMLVYEKTLPLIESYSSVRFLQSRIHRLLRMYLLRDYFQGTKLGGIPVHDPLSASTDELALKFYASVDSVRQSSEEFADLIFRRDYRPSKSPEFTQILDKVMGAVVTGGASEKGAIDHVVSAITAKGVYNAYLRTRDYLVKKRRLDPEVPVRLAFNGAGDVGGSAAMMAARGGDLVVMMQDVNGAVYSKKGFSVQKLQEFNNIPPAKRNVVEFFGRIPGAIPLSREKMFSGDREFEIDVIVTAATANTINESNVDTVIRSGLKAIIEGGNNTYKNVAARLAQAGVITAWGSTANIGGVIASSHENQAKHRFTVSELTLPTLQSLPDGKIVTAMLTGHHTTVPLSRTSAKAPERKVRSTIELQDDRVIKPSTAFPDLPLNTLVDLVEVSKNGETVWKAYVNNMEVGEVDSANLVQRLRFLVDGETNHVEVRGGTVASANPAFPDIRPGPVRLNYPVRDRKYETYQFVGDVINAYQTVVLALIEPGNPEMDSIKVQRALSRALAEKKKEIFLSEVYREKREKSVRELIDSGYVAAPEEMLHLVSARLAREEMLSFTKSAEGVLEFVETVNPFTGERIRVSRDFEILPSRPADFSRSELRAEEGNPYALEENVTRGFAQLDEMHGGRIRTSLNSRIAAGNKPRVLLIGVGRGVVSADMLREYGDKIELYSTAKEDLLFSPEQLEAFWEGKVSGAETAGLISTLKDRYVISDAEKNLGAFDSLSFDVIVITQTVMQYIKNKPGLIDRLSTKLALQGELMTDFDVFSIKDSATGSSVDIKAFFESLGPDYEAYGITLGKTQAPISLLAGLRFTRSSNQINEIPLDATDNAKVYHPRRSELRATPSNPYELMAKKISAAKESLLPRYAEDPYFEDFFEEVQWMFPMDHLAAKTVTAQRLEIQIETAYRLYAQHISDPSVPFRIASSDPDGADLTEFIVVTDNRTGLLGDVSAAISAENGDIRETYFRVISNPLNNHEVAINFFEVTNKTQKALNDEERRKTDDSISKKLRARHEAQNQEIRISGAIKNRDTLLQGEVAAFLSSDGDLESVAYDVFEDMRDNRDVEDIRKVSERLRQDITKLYTAAQNILHQLGTPGLLPESGDVVLTAANLEGMKGYIDFLLNETIRLTMKPVQKTSAHRQNAGSIFLNLVRSHMQKAESSGDPVHGLLAPEIHYVARIVLDQMRPDISVVNPEDNRETQSAQIEAEKKNFTEALHAVLNVQAGAMSPELAERLSGLDSVVRDLIAEQVIKRIEGDISARNAEEVMPLKAVRAIPLVVLPVIEKWREEGERAGSQKLLDNAADLESIFKEVIKRLRKQGTEGESLGVMNVRKELILFAHELDPFKLIRLTKEYRIKAIATDGAGFASHWVLVAENLNIPVFIVDQGQQGFDLMDTTWVGRKAVLDGRGPGNKPVLILNASDATQNEYKPRLEVQVALDRIAMKHAHEPAVSSAGQEVAFLANADTPEELTQAFEYYGAEGDGLDRTEYLFQGKNVALTRFLENPDTENETALRMSFQNTFSEMGESVRSGEVTIRMFDMQRDKEDAAFSLLNPDKIYGPAYYRTPVGKALLRIEIEAAIRAHMESSRGQIKVLFPMFRSPQDLIALLNERGFPRKDLKDLSAAEQALLNEVAKEDASFMVGLFDEVREKILSDKDALERVAERHKALAENLPKYQGAEPTAEGVGKLLQGMKRGIMIETVEGLEILDEMFDIADFFSVGTNDLTISLFRELGISRERNPEYFDHVEFKVFEAIQNRIFDVVHAKNQALKDAGQERQVSVTVCGGLACMDTFVLMALHKAPPGRELQLSGSAGLIPALKEIVRKARPEDSAFVASATNTDELIAGANEALENIRQRQLENEEYLTELKRVQEGVVDDSETSKTPRSEVLEEYDPEEDLRRGLAEFQAKGVSGSAEKPSTQPAPQVQSAVKYLLGPVGLHMFPASKIIPFLSKNKTVQMQIKKESGEVVAIKSMMDLMMGFAEFSEIEIVLNGEEDRVREFERLIASIPEPDHDMIPTFSTQYVRRNYRLAQDRFTDTGVASLQALIADLPGSPALAGYVHTQSGRFYALSNAEALKELKLKAGEEIGIIWLGALSQDAMTRMERIEDEGQLLFQSGETPTPEASVSSETEFLIGPLGLHMLPPMQIKAKLTKLPEVRATLTAVTGTSVDMRKPMDLMGLGTATSLKKVKVKLEGPASQVAEFEKFLNQELLEEFYGVPVFARESAEGFFLLNPALTEDETSSALKSFAETVSGVALFALSASGAAIHLNSEGAVRNSFKEFSSAVRIFAQGQGAQTALHSLENVKAGETPLFSRAAESKTIEILLGPVGLHMIPITGVAKYLREHKALKVSFDVPGTGVVDAGNPMSLMTLAVPAFGRLKIIMKGSSDEVSAFETYLHEKILEPDYDGVPAFNREYSGRSYKVAAAALPGSALDTLQEILVSQAAHPEFSGFLYKDGRVIPLQNRTKLSELSFGEGQEAFSLYLLGPKASEVLQAIEGILSEGAPVFIPQGEIVRSELRSETGDEILSTRDWKLQLRESARQPFRLDAFGPEEQAFVTEVSGELDGLYYEGSIASLLPEDVTVQLSSTAFELPREDSVRLWITRQVAVENGLFESNQISDPDLRQMLSAIEGLPAQAPEDQGEAGFAASIHVQLESAPELSSLLPVLAVAVSVNGAFHLNIDSMNEEQAGEFEKVIRELAVSKTMKFKPGQIQVKGSLQAGVFATVPQSKFSERDKHALIGKEEAFRNVHKRKGQNLFSLDPSAVKNPGLFASTVITVLQAIALGKQPEEYFQVLDPRSLNPDHFADILQTVTTYLAAQARIQAAA